jgi:hypothetical protein
MSGKQRLKFTIILRWADKYLYFGITNSSFSALSADRERQEDERNVI